MAPLLSDDEVTRGLEGLDWTRQGDAIVTTVLRQDFAGALAFVNAVGSWPRRATTTPISPSRGTR
jgi:pterin-4a-carbinolamine dehydratase